MKLQVFTLHFDPYTGQFDASALDAFLQDHEALDVSEHWFTRDGLPALALLVRYRGATAAPRRPHPSATAPEPGAPPERQIAPEHRAAYEALRHWRNLRAKRDGRPPYVLFTNNQVAAIASSGATTRAELAKVHGLGEARLTEYGEELLALLREAAGATVEHGATRVD